MGVASISLWVAKGRAVQSFQWHLRTGKAPCCAVQPLCCAQSVKHLPNKRERCRRARAHVHTWASTFKSSRYEIDKALQWRPEAWRCSPAVSHCIFPWHEVAKRWERVAFPAAWEHPCNVKTKRWIFCVPLSPLLRGMLKSIPLKVVCPLPFHRSKLWTLLQRLVAWLYFRKLLIFWAFLLSTEDSQLGGMAWTKLVWINAIGISAH